MKPYWTLKNFAITMSLLLTTSMTNADEWSGHVSGFFGGKTQFVNQLINEHPKSISPTGYKLLFDLLKVIPRDTSIGEFSYTFQARLAGESKIGMKQILTYFRSLF